MQRLADIIPHSRADNLAQTYDPVESENKKAEWYNSTAGDLDKADGYNCPECKNRGMIAVVVVRDGVPETIMQECKCKAVRSSIRQMKMSGLYDMAKRCTFDNYTTQEAWQKEIKAKAMRFAKTPEGWLFLGGQPGAGKTHLGVATAVAIMHERKKDAKYFVWPDAIRGTWGNFEAYQSFVDEAKAAQLLYIDDLFKPVQDRGATKMPTANEVESAFQVLNYRYNKPGLHTIISCEFTVSELCQIDEALGSRIIEATRGTDSCISIGKKPGRNYRLRGIGDI